MIERTKDRVHGAGYTGRSDFKGGVHVHITPARNVPDYSSTQAKTENARIIVAFVFYQLGRLRVRRSPLLLPFVVAGVVVS